MLYMFNKRPHIQSTGSEVVSESSKIFTTYLILHLGDLSTLQNHCQEQLMIFLLHWKDIPHLSLNF